MKHLKTLLAVAAFSLFTVNCASLDKMKEKHMAELDAKVKKKACAKAKNAKAKKKLGCSKLAH